MPNSLHPDSVAAIAARVRAVLARPGAGDGNVRAPLAPAVTDQGDPIVDGVIEGFAEILHTLAFYGDRIRDEAALTTARQPRSIRLLIDMLGIEPMPAVSSSVPLAFSVLADPDNRDQAVDIPAGTQAESEAEGDSQSQVFETAQAITGYAAWNAARAAADAIVPAPLRVELKPVGHAELLRWELDGVEPAVKVDSFLLVSAQQPAQQRWLLRVVARKAASTTQRVELRVVWTDGPGHLALDPTIQLLGRRARLFEARAWETAPPLAGFDRAEFSDSGNGDWKRLDLEDLGEVRCFVKDKDGVLFAGTRRNGIFRSEDGGRTWEPSSDGLMHTGIHDLKFSEYFGLVAGTDGTGVYRSTDNGNYWTLISGSEYEEPPVVPGGDENRQFYNKHGELIQTRRVGLKLLNPASAQRLHAPVRAVEVDESVASQSLGVTVIAGTDAGAIVSFNYGVSWWMASKGLRLYRPRAQVAGCPVRCLARIRLKEDVSADTTRSKFRDFVLAGTAFGVYHWNHRAHEWVAAIREDKLLFQKLGFDADASVEALWPVPDGSGRVLIASQGQVFLAERGEVKLATFHVGDAKIEVGEILKLDIKNKLTFPDGDKQNSPDKDKQTVPGQVVGLSGCESSTGYRVLAATDIGIFVLELRSSALVGEWTQHNKGLLQTKRHAVLAVPTDESAASPTKPEADLSAGPPRELRTEDWQGLDYGLQAIDLDDQYPAIATGDVVALLTRSDQDTVERAQLFTIQSVRVQRARLGRTQLDVSQLKLSDPIAATKPRFTHATEILTEPETVTLHDQDGGIQVVSGNTLILEGRLPLLEPGRWIAVGGLPILARVGDKHYTVGHLERIDPKPEWILLDSDGHADKHTYAFENVILDRATDMRWALLTVTACRHDRNRTELKVANPWGQDSLIAGLPCALDGASLQVFANVAIATHGETERDLVLGSGDHSQISQVFALGVDRLAHTRNPVTGDIEPAVDVRVDQHVTWTRLPPHTAVGDPRVYELIRHGAGAYALRFGRGARLPTGRGNVSATVRVGGGVEGNVRAGGIRQLGQAPASVDAVSNPLPARGGAPAESTELLRRRIGPRIRTLGRVVTLSDLEDFLRLQPEIGACVVQAVGDKVVVVAADIAGRPFEPSSDALVMAAIERAVSGSGLSDPDNVDILGFEPVHLQLALTVETDGATDPEHVREQIQAVLLDLLDPTRGAVRRRLDRALVFYAVHTVDGVNGASITAFKVEGEKVSDPDRRWEITALDSHMEGGQVRAAQLLMLTPTDLVITMETP